MTVWHQLRADGEHVARCPVARLMRAAGLQGVVRGGRVRTTRPTEDPAAASQDLVQRQFTAERPKQLWVADFTYGETDGGLVVHSDRGSQYVAMRYTERLADAGIAPSVGSVGAAYENALAESVLGLCKAELIHRRGPWRGFDDVEYATLEWVAWFNQQRLLAPLGYVAPAVFEEQFYRAQTAHAAAVALT